MSFKFLHSADWHIGKTYGGFDADQAVVLRQARLETVATLGHLATQHDISHVLVAGDVFDAPGLEDAVVRALLVRLGQFEQVTWHLLPGNHDPATPRGIWDGVVRRGVPGNVSLHLEAVPTEIAPGVMLLPAPCLAKKSEIDLTAWMDTAETPAGMIRIGLAHGGVIGFDTSEDSDGGLISPTRAQDARLDYLALGDWHGCKQVSAACWYSGTPEPDKFPRNEPGYVIIVEIDDAGTAPIVTPFTTRKFTWQEEALTLSSVDDLDGIRDVVRQLGVAAQLHLIKLSLSGQVTLSDRTAIADRIEDLAAQVHVLKADLKDLKVVTTETDLQTIGEGELRDVADRLRLRAEDPTNPEARIAALALQKLFIASRSAGGAA